KRELGFLPAIPTAIYDTLKGVLAIFIAHHLLKTSMLVAYLSGFAAVLGHIFPFYIKFKGGQGAAAMTGILLYNLYQIFVVNSAKFIIWDLIVLVITILLIMITTHTQEILSIIILPLFAYLLLLRTPFNWTLVSTLIIVGYLLYLGISNIIKFQLLTIDRNKYPDFRLWRTLARPLAMAFPILSFYLKKPVLITLIGSVLAVFFITDLVRILHSKVNQVLVKDIKQVFAIYKDKETVRISSMTLFLLGCFLSFLFFEREIAITVITFLIFGDLFAKIFGLAYGKHKLFNKTLEGTLAHLMACIIAGYITYIYFKIPFGLVLAGATSATIVEALPFNVDDNLSVPIVAGAIIVIGTKLM
ncbi:MAG: glycerol-3-phosphate acyltransferase, partial [candidate division WOR-3 bacterium]